MRTSTQEHRRMGRNIGVNKMGQQLRALAALAEDSVSISRLTRQLTNICKVITRVSDTGFWPSWILNIHLIQRETDMLTKHPCT